MPDQYGNVIPSDLQAVVDHFSEEVSALLSMVKSLHRVTNLTEEMDAKVIKHAKYLSLEEKAYGIGAIQIEIPRHDITSTNNFWASPHRTLQGRFEVPPIDSWVRVKFRDGHGGLAEYYGGKFHDVSALVVPGTTEAPNAEEIGFISSFPSDTYGGGKLTEARQNPDKLRIIESSKDVLIAEDKTSKSLSIRTRSGWETRLTAGPGGKVVIGAFDPMLGSTGSGTDVEIDGGTAGKFSVTLKNGKWSIKTSSEASIDAEDVNITASGKITLDGDTEIKGKLDVTKEVTANSEGTPTTLSKHMHPTSIPGPPSPPTPGT